MPRLLANHNRRLLSLKKDWGLVHYWENVRADQFKSDTWLKYLFEIKS